MKGDLRKRPQNLWHVRSVQSSWPKTIEDVDGFLAGAISQGIVAEAAGAFAQQAL